MFQNGFSRVGELMDFVLLSGTNTTANSRGPCCTEVRLKQTLALIGYSGCARIHNWGLFVCVRLIYDCHRGSYWDSSLQPFSIY